jgi:hypothetical protein
MRTLMWDGTRTLSKIRWFSKCSVDFYGFYVVIVTHEVDFK